MTNIKGIYHLEIDEDLASKIRLCIALTKQMQWINHGSNRWYELKYQRDDLREDICIVVEIRFENLPF